MNEPIDHHYIPVFYLDRWAGEDKRVCRFNRPHGNEVKAKRVSPKGTGFEPGLYEAKGVPPDRAQSMEKDFMAKLDSDAARALRLLETGLPESEWQPAQRYDWSRFMLTQMLRSPEDIAQHKANVGQAWEKELPGLEQRYADQREPGDPATVLELLDREQPGHADIFALDVARNLMCHPLLCDLFSAMHWLVLDTPEDGYPVLTSDRPIWMTSSLSEEEAFVMMPISPRKIFTATAQRSTQARIRARTKAHLVKALNKILVENAVKYVYGIDDAMLPFIQKYMSVKSQPSLSERMARSQGVGLLNERK